MATRTKRITTALQTLSDEIRATYQNKNLLDKAIVETSLVHLKLVEQVILFPEDTRIALRERVSPAQKPMIITGVGHG